MKRLFCVIIAALLLLGLVSCGSGGGTPGNGNESQSNSASPPSSAEQNTVAPPEQQTPPEPETPPAPVTNAVAVWIDYSPAVNEDFTMTVTVSDSVNSPRTPLSQAARHKSDNGESFSAEGSGPDGKVLVFFDNALVYEYDVNFDTGEIH